MTKRAVEELHESILQVRDMVKLEITKERSRRSRSAFLSNNSVDIAQIEENVKSLTVGAKSVDELSKKIDSKLKDTGCIIG